LDEKLLSLNKLLKHMKSPHSGMRMLIRISGQKIFDEIARAQGLKTYARDNLVSANCQYQDITTKYRASLHCHKILPTICMFPSLECSLITDPMRFVDGHSTKADELASSKVWDLKIKTHHFEDPKTIL
jgi:hypothetical protein